MAATQAKSTTLQDLSVQLAEQAELADDYICDTRRMGFFVNSAGTEEAPEEGPGSVGVTVDDIDATFNVNDHAQDQMAARLKLPRAFWDRMRDSHPDILQDTVSKLLVREPEVRMVRTLGPDARAYLSNRYRRIDNYDYMARAIAPALAELGDERVTVLDARLTDLRMYVKVLFPDISITPPDGHELHGGAILGNSEVGAGSFFIDPFLYRSFCLNGMVFGKQTFADFGLRKMHVGPKIDDTDAARAMFSDDTMRKEDEVLFAQAHDMIKGCVNGMRFEAIKEAIEKASGVLLDGDVPATVEKLGKASGLREGEQTALMAHLIQGGDLSAWGYMNAVTRTARDVLNFDRQIELERVGGEMLSWSAQAWRQIAVQAAVA